MKRFKKVFMALAFIFAGVLAFSLASNTKVHAEPTTFDFSSGVHNAETKTITWSDSVLTILQEQSTGQTEPNSSYISAPRWYAGNVVTFTPASNCIISELTITCNTNNYATTLTSSTWSTGTATNNNTVVTWVGSAEEAFTVKIGGQVRISSLSYSYSEVVAPTSVSIPAALNMTVGDNSTLTATIYPDGATNKKVTWASLDSSIATVDQSGKVVAVAEGTTTIEAALDYDNTIKASCTVVVSAVSHQEFVDFKALDLQEQLSFNYKYSNEFEPTTSIVSGNTYYLGNTVSNVAYVITNTTLGASSNLNQAVEFTISSSSEGYYYIIMNDKYLGSGSGTNVTTNTVAATATADTTGKYEWSFATDTGRLVNKSTGRYLCFSDANYSTVKAYASSNSNLAVTLIPTDGAVTFKDAANNADRVTMRIGYTISKTLYELLEALGTTVTFGVRLNDTTNVECTKVVVDENTYKLFVAVNNIPLDKIDTVITACGYVSVDGTDTYTTEVNTYSVKTLAQEYLTNHTDNEAVVTAKYALVYLAYYA